MDNMKSKIEKLLRLANDKGATEAERDSALAMAQTLMMKYNMDVKLGSEEATVKQSEIWGEDFIRSYQKRVLAPAVAAMYTCKVLHAHGGGYIFVGRPESIDACKVTFVSIVDQLEMLWNEHKKGLRKAGQAGALSNNYRRSFKYAAAVTVWNRIIELNERIKKDDTEAIKATGCTALVVVDSIKAQLADIALYIEKNMQTRKGRGHGAISGAGTGAGRVAGESVKINKEMGTSKLALPSK